MHHDHNNHHHLPGSNPTSPGFIFPALPLDHQGLEQTSQLKRAQRNFIGINNNLGFDMFKATLEYEKHKKENLIFSTLSATTSLALGMFSHKISITTFSGHIHFKQNKTEILSDPKRVILYRILNKFSYLFGEI